MKTKEKEEADILKNKVEVAFAEYIEASKNLREELKKQTEDDIYDIGQLLSAHVQEKKSLKSQKSQKSLKS